MREAAMARKVARLRRTRCPICGEVFESSNKRMKHMEEHNAKPYEGKIESK
jgi:uncharacterized C2H2 Zn-finger protein